MYINTRKHIKPFVAPVLKHLNNKSSKFYHDWLKHNDLSLSDIEKQKENSQKFKYRPLISLIVPIYNTPITFLKEMADSVLKQTYDNWELILIDDASTDKNIQDVVNKYAQADSRVITKFLIKNHHISGATNEGIKIAKGEFVSLLDHDDLLWRGALYEVIEALNINKNLNFIYTDEDKLDASTKYKHRDPFFKPDWNPDLLRSVNYITHFTTIRRSLLEKFGYENSEYDGAQDWELFLRITRNIPSETIYHIPKVLYSWRMHSNSTSKSFETKPYVVKAQHAAIEKDLVSRDMPEHTLEQDPMFSAQWRVEFTTAKESSITFVLSHDANLKNRIEHLRHSNLHTLALVNDDLSDIINEIKTAYTMFVYDSNKVINHNVIKTMIGDAQRSEIAFVVAGYLDKNSYNLNVEDLIHKEYARLVSRMGRRSLSSHIYRTARYNIPVVHELSCALIATEKLQKSFKGKVSDNTIEKISRSLAKEHGYRHLYLPYV